jgi:hypothetical protein
MNNVATPGNIADLTGIISTDPQSAAGTIGINSSCVGIGNTAAGLRSNAFGFKAFARIQDTTNICGPIIVKKDNGEGSTAALKFRNFCGVRVELMTEEIDFLAAAADYEIALPAGCHFWLDEVDWIVTAKTGAAITAQPTVRAGIVGTLAKYLAATLTTLLTAAFKRERYSTLLADDGESSAANLSVGITVPATLAGAGTFLGRAIISGRLIEDE